MYGPLRSLFDYTYQKKYALLAIIFCLNEKQFSEQRLQRTLKVSFCIH